MNKKSNCFNTTRHASPYHGFNEWDGSHFSYFIEGEEGIHPSGGRLFNFGKIETQRLLLSNLGYFLTEYKIDGFRFHDIPSIIYRNHGNILKINTIALLIIQIGYTFLFMD